MDFYLVQSLLVLGQVSVELFELRLRFRRKSALILGFEVSSRIGNKEDRIGRGMGEGGTEVCVYSTYYFNIHGCEGRRRSSQRS